MVPKQVWYRFPGIDYCTVSIQRGKVPIPICDYCIHPFTHDHGGNHARHQPTHQEQPGSLCLAQGLFDTNQEGARDRTGNRSGNFVIPKRLEPLSPQVLAYSDKRGLRYSHWDVKLELNN